MGKTKTISAKPIRDCWAKIEFWVDPEAKAIGQKLAKFKDGSKLATYVRKLFLADIAKNQHLVNGHSASAKPGTK